MSNENIHEETARLTKEVECFHRRTAETGFPMPAYELVDALAAHLAAVDAALKGREVERDEWREILDTKLGVIDAVDRTLEGAPEQQVERFKKGYLHASRAIGVQNILNDLTKAEADRDRLQREVEELRKNQRPKSFKELHPDAQEHHQATYIPAR